MKFSRCSAPGKLVLLGEYVVLEGAPAIVAAMDRRAVVTAQAASRFSLTVEALQLQAAPFDFIDGAVHFADAALQQSPRLRYFRALGGALFALAQQLGGPLTPCALCLDTSAFFLPAAGSEPPQKFGLGSSAALCVALAGALLHQADLLGPFLPLHQAAAAQRLLQRAHPLHQLAQKNAGSGVDVAASIFGGLCRFVPPRPPTRGTPRVHPLKMPADLSMVTIWSGQSASTPAMLQKVAALKTRAPQQYWALHEKLATYAQAGADFWALQDVAALGQVIDATFTTLRELGEACDMQVVTAAHAAIQQIVRRAGGFYKTSGAGGGDVGVAFCPSHAIAERLIRRLRKTAYRVVPLSVDAQGIEVSSA